MCRWSAIRTLGFRYRGMYGVMAPDEYAMPFSDGGLMSLRAIAIEVKNPGITKADGEDVWLNNFRNTFFTQYGIIYGASPPTANGQCGSPATEPRAAALSADDVWHLTNVDRHRRCRAWP